MKPQRHTRKEFISILIVSNTGGKNKEIQMSRLKFNVLRNVPFMFVVMVLLFGGVIFLGQRKMASLRGELEPYKQQIAQLETKQEGLNAENTRLADENAQLKQQMEAETETADETTQEQPEENPYEDAPDGYPYTGAGGSFASEYSEEQPYMSIYTHTDGEVIAAGDGTVISVSSDDT